MKRKVLIFSLLILVGAAVSSCLIRDKDEDEPSLQKEMAILNEFIRNAEKDGFNIDTTELGVYYFVVEPGLGAYPQIGNNLTVKYDGYLMNGYLFYSSLWNYDKGEVNFVLGEGEGEAIEGWTDGMKVIKKGSKVQLMIPSSLGYGSQWQGEIPPYSTLVYVVEMVNIK